MLHKTAYRFSTEPFGSSFISVSVSLASNAHITVASYFYFQLSQSLHNYWSQEDFFLTPISNVGSVCRYKLCRRNNPACYQLFDCILKIRRRVICNCRYTHFPSFRLLSFAPYHFGHPSSWYYSLAVRLAQIAHSYIDQTLKGPWES